MTERSMQNLSRRAVLGTASGFVAGLAGCVSLGGSDDSPKTDEENDDTPNSRDNGDDNEAPRNDDTPTPPDSQDSDEDETPEQPVTDGDFEWRYEVGGNVDAITDGLVLARQHFRPQDSPGGVVALDTETGDQQWQYGSTNGLGSIYTSLAVTDAVYLGQGDDQIGGGTGQLMAVEFDGTERWVHECGTIYQQPVVTGDAVYAGSDDGTVRAVETDSGELRWETDEVEPDDAIPSVGPEVVAVEDVAYVNALELVALDPADGTVRWRYGDIEDPDKQVSTPTVADGVVYLSVAGTDVAAVSDGDHQWRESFDHETTVRGVEAGVILVEVQVDMERSDLHALDAKTGDSLWSIETNVGPRFRVATDRERVYVGGDKFSAFDLKDGTDRWETNLGEERVDTVTVDSESGRLYVERSETLYSLTRSGEIVDSINLASINEFAIGDLAYVGTEAGIYAVDFE